ncbi:MAG: MerR family transcriptional regulator [Solirubrobacterales bacterium]|nr:MerR family transcriptional regulator [Solirubrobacterales bacterium]
MTTDETPVLRIGALAKRTGLSVRTLRHYDELGLLEPAERTFAGHRLYSSAEVRRLYRIVALRRLGLGLAEIAALLDRDDADPLSVVREHVAELERRIRLEQELRDRLERIAAALDRMHEPSVTDYLDAIEGMTMIERHYTPEQLDYLARRRTEVGEEAIREVEDEWPRLYAEMRAEMQRGAGVTEPRVQELAARMRELVGMFHGGDEGSSRP